MLTKQAAEYIKLGTGGSYSLSRDAIKHRIYDTRYFGTTISDHTFFSQPLGAPWSVNNKTINETNLNDSGKLPNGQTFLVTRMGICCIAPIENLVAHQSHRYAKHFNNIMQNSVFEIQILGREFDFQVHGSEFMPRPLSLYSAYTDAGTDYVLDGGVGDMIASGWKSLDPAPIFVDQLVSFKVIQRLGNPVAFIDTVLDADSSSLAGIYATMQVTLEGFLTRAK